MYAKKPISCKTNKQKHQKTKPNKKLNNHESAPQLKTHCISLWVPLRYLYYHYVFLLRCKHYPDICIFINLCFTKTNSMIWERVRDWFSLLRDFPYQQCIKTVLLLSLLVWPLKVSSRVSPYVTWGESLFQIPLLT